MSTRIRFEFTQRSGVPEREFARRIEHCVTRRQCGHARGHNQRVFDQRSNRFENMSSFGKILADG